MEGAEHSNVVCWSTNVRQIELTCLLACCTGSIGRCRAPHPDCAADESHYPRCHAAEPALRCYGGTSIRVHLQRSKHATQPCCVSAGCETEPVGHCREYDPVDGDSRGEDGCLA